MSPVPASIGVVGAGTMGAGIAQLAAQAGARTVLHDPVPEALARGAAQIEQALARSVTKGRLSADESAAVRERLVPASTLDELAHCELVIEAAPERLELKIELMGRLAELCGEDCVLATNTSSLSVTEIAAGLPRPERVVGLHFFNPAPVMRLAEVIPGVATSAQTLATARALGEAMGKRVIDAADIPGFLVNRVNRPFYLESLRIVAEQIASPEQIDRIFRMAGGFRMGPFELMDLIGVDTNHAVSEGFYRQTFGEARYRPSPLAARMVAAGRLGRKSGRGWYDHDPDAPQRAPDPEPSAAGGGVGRDVTVWGASTVADELRAALTGAGFTVDASADPWLVLDCEGDGEGARDAPVALLLDQGSLHLRRPSAAGFHVLPPFGNARLVECTRTPATDPEAAARLEALVGALGRHPEWVGDGTGLVLGRVVAQLVNEAAFLIGEGNGTADDIDAGMELGVNHPRGPIAWSEQAGLDHVLAILDGLQDEGREERHRAAPLLRRRAALGTSLREV